MKTKLLWLLALSITIFWTACQKEISVKQSKAENPEMISQPNSVLQVSSEQQCSVVKNLKGIGENTLFGTFSVTDLGSDLQVVITAKAGFYITNAVVTWGSLDEVNNFTASWDNCQGDGQFNEAYDFGQTTTVSFVIPAASLDENGCVWIAANVEVMSNESTVRCTYPVPADPDGLNSEEWKSAFKFCRCLPPPPPPPGDCGQLRTQTPGGWGAEPNGNNPGTYLHAHFAAAFPSGLSIGSGFKVSFDDAQDITDYLPSGGQSKVLTKNYLNPLPAELKNTLVNHLIALTLSVRFDATDPGFGDAGITLGQMEISSGAFAGWTVNAFLQRANEILGGTSQSHSIQDVLTTVTAINENYVDGKIDNKYLTCPE